MTAPDEPNPTPEHLLAEVIGSHFVKSRLVDHDGVNVVELGEGLPVIECHINSMQDTPPYGVFITLVIRGGALGTQGATVTASGYGENMYHSVIAAGCNWACAFGPVLLHGIGRPELVNTEYPDVEQFETVLGGRRYLVTMSGLDRGGGISTDEVATYRQRLGGSRALTTTVLASGTLPATRSDDVIPLGCFLGVGEKNFAEVKYGAGDWPAAQAILADVPCETVGYRMLREWALLTPLEPAQPLTRDSLQYTLDLLRTTSDDPQSESGWLGGRHHAMRLGNPDSPNISLPDDAHWFFSQIAASGAGPGYGLDLRPSADGWLHLADAGCGAEWLLRLADGSVWLDARACDDTVKQVAPSFTAWYEAWLDNAIRGGGFFAQWNYYADAAYQVLAQTAEEHGIEKLPEKITRVQITTPQEDFTGPCHACESAYNRCGVPSTVFTRQ